MGQNAAPPPPPPPTPSTCLVSSWVPRSSRMDAWQPCGIRTSTRPVWLAGGHKGQGAKRWSEPGRMVQAPGLPRGPAPALGVQGARGALSRGVAFWKGPFSLPPESKGQRGVRVGGEMRVAWLGGGVQCPPGGAAFSVFGGRKGIRSLLWGPWFSGFRDENDPEGGRAQVLGPPEVPSLRVCPGGGSQPSRGCGIGIHGFPRGNGDRVG